MTHVELRRTKQDGFRVSINGMDISTAVRAVLVTAKPGDWPVVTVTLQPETIDIDLEAAEINYDDGRI
jgi:hypothetical protein